MLQRTLILSTDSFTPIRLDLARNIRSKIRYLDKNQVLKFYKTIENYIKTDFSYKVSLEAISMVLQNEIYFDDVIKKESLKAVITLLTSEYYDMEIKIEVLELVMETLSKFPSNEIYSIFDEAVERLGKLKNPIFLINFVAARLKEITKINEQFSNSQLTKTTFKEIVELICEHPSNGDLVRLFEFVGNFTILDKDTLNELFFSRMFELLDLVGHSVITNLRDLLIHADCSQNLLFATLFMHHFDFLKKIAREDWHREAQFVENLALSDIMFAEKEWPMVLFEYGFTLIDRPYYLLQTKGAALMAKSFKWLRSNSYQNTKLALVAKKIFKSNSYYKLRLAIPFLEIVTKEMSYSWLRSHGVLEKAIELLIDCDYISFKVVSVLKECLPFIMNEPITEIKTKFELNIDKLTSLPGKSNELLRELKSLKIEMKKLQQNNCDCEVLQQELVKTEREANLLVYDRTRTKVKSLSTTNAKKNRVQVNF